MNVINDYNKSVEEKIKKASKDLGISIEKFAPVDSKGIPHMLGLFDCEVEKGHKFSYKEFITQGAKKYAYIKDDEKDSSIHITLAGVPKSGAKALKSLSEFKNNFVFEFKYTNKLLIQYVDDMEEFELRDYHNKKLVVKDKYGCCLIPTTYVLGKSEEYEELVSDFSSKRAIYNENKEEE